MMRPITYLILLSIAIPCSASELRFATGHWPPFYAKDLPNNGFVAEITREALKRKGYKMTIDFMPFKRAKHLTRKGEYIGLIGCWNTPENRIHYNISKTSLADGSAHFLAPKEKGITINSFDDLLDKRLGIVRGYATSNELKNLFDNGKVTPFYVNQIKQLLYLIQVGDRVDLILENIHVAKYVADKNFPGETFQLEVVGEDNLDGGIYICWSKNRQNAGSVYRDFDNAIEEMHQDGTLYHLQPQLGINP